MTEQDDSESNRLVGEVRLLARAFVARLPVPEDVGDDVAQEVALVACRRLPTLAAMDSEELLRWARAC